MKKIVFISVILMGVFSCGKTEDETIIPEQKFISLLVQMHLIEADFSFNPEVDHRSMKKNYAQYESLFKRYKTDSLQVVNTFNYYDNKQDDLLRIYKTVLDCLNTMAGKSKPAVPNPAK